MALYNEKAYVIEPLRQALTRLGYNLSLSKIPKRRTTNYGLLNSDYHYFMIQGKTSVKRLLEPIKLTLFRKRLRACLIKHALSDPREPDWGDIKPIRDEINAVYKGLLVKSKRLARAFYASWQELEERLKRKEITLRGCEARRSGLEAEVWDALQALKSKYDVKSNELEEKIKTCFQAESPNH